MEKNGRFKMENGEKLRLAMRNWASSVAVVTSSCLGARAGTTISSFTSLSLDPPLVLFNLALDNPLQTMIEQSGIFGITILASGQRELSDRFAGFDKRIQDRFDGLETFTLNSPAPLLEGGLAWLDCRVYHLQKLPKSIVVIGEIVEGKVGEEGRPLVYLNRAYVGAC
jgi:flavin reductase (DIM6/NTAB) family NADH-FMN oxidoreductase RutF